MSQPQPFIIETQDGHKLGATAYRTQHAKATVIVAGATGVPQGFYTKFATFAATQGFDVVTFDYRGIGQSAPKSLRGFDMQYLDWAYKDLCAVVDEVATPDQPVYLIGHSFGGHALGLLPNQEKISAAYFFGTGAGWHGWMPKSEQWRVLLMWNVIGPLVTRFCGYLAWKTLGMGENLPLGVYRYWKRWCRYPHYFFDAPEMTHVKEEFARVEMPIAAANAMDDKWASPKARDAFMQGYVNAKLENLDVAPESFGNQGIGHMGYFRSHCEPLWHSALQWFEAKNTTA